MVPVLRSAALALACLLVAACGSQDRPPVQPIENVGAGDDWAAVGGAADESSFSRLTGINGDTIGRLGLAWSLDLPGEVTLEATPLAIGGTLYFTGSHANVYAVDGQSGEVLWTYDPQVWKRNPGKMHFSFGANRGLAFEDGRVFVAALDGRVIALDAKSGEELWTAESIPPGALNISTGAPRVMNGKVIIGNGGADFGARGFVTTFDARTGEMLWRFYTAPGHPDENKGDPAMERAEKTWTGEWWKTGTGGTVWNGMTFDAERNRVYIGTGNAGPYDPSVRSPEGGDNLYLVSIVALDADTGEYIWHYQHNPLEAWDYKSTANIVMATLPIDGEQRDVLLQIPTNGFFYVLDRETGKLLSAEPATEVTWAKGIDLETGRPIENPDIRYETGLTEIWPGAIGGHNWQAMSYSPKTGLVYVPMHQMGHRFARGGEQTDDAFDVMGLVAEPIIEKPGDGKGSLLAWDPVKQEAAWEVQHEGLWNGGTMVTAGDIVFQGTADGLFRAYDARSGDEVWQFDAGLGIIAAPMSYRVNGKQYVSILVGYGGTTAAYGKYMDMGYKYGAQERRLLTFALDGEATIPPAVPRDKTVRAIDDPDLVIDEADVVAGRSLSIRCAACHGVGLQSPGTPGPDLRESAIALDLGNFTQLLRSGPLLERGMPRFDDLSETQIRQLHAYIRARARDALGKRKSNETAAPARM